MLRGVLLLITLSGCFTSAPVFAQWQFSVGAGVRQAKVSETAPGGRQLVSEAGWLPGVALTARYKVRDWRLGLSAETYSGDIDYDGGLQTGTPFSTTTGTRQDRVDLDIAYAVTERTDLIAMVEWDRWKRDINGRGAVLGLQERTTSKRLLAGAETALFQAPAASVKIRALLVYAEPEQLRVQFDQRIYDDAAFSTKPAVGARLALELEPSAFPDISITTQFDWLRIRRSDDAPLYQSGALVGTVAQPEHKRTAFSVMIRYRF